MPRPPSAVAIIPARMGSTRFPGKVLKADTGKPLIVHVCEQAAKADSVSRVVVATDAPEVESAVRAAGFEAVMTGDHPNGTSRLAEACGILGLEPKAAIINVQGDEPEIEPGVIDAAHTALCFGKASPGDQTVGTAVTPVASKEQFEDPNIVKAAISGRPMQGPGPEVGVVHYFSRAPIPYPRNPSDQPAWRHVGIYAYTVGSIRAYLGWPPSPLEEVESLEQLRWLKAGYRITAAYTNASHTGIDTEEQYRAFVARQSARSAGK